MEQAQKIAAEVIKRLSPYCDRLLIFLEIIPLKLCPRFWCWLLHRLGRI